MKSPFGRHCSRKPNRRQRRPWPQMTPKVAKMALKDAKGGKGEGSKGLPSPTSHPKAKPKAKPKTSDEGSKGAGSGKGDGKGKGKSKPDEKKDAKLRPKAKASTVPCLFYPQGTCNRGDQCPFLHEPKAAAKPKAAATAKATVAFVVAWVQLVSPVHRHPVCPIKNRMRL